MLRRDFGVQRNDGIAEHVVAAIDELEEITAAGDDGQISDFVDDQQACRKSGCARKADGYDFPLGSCCLS